MKVYSYKKCSTCRKALKFLESQGVDYKEIDITENAPNKSELKTMLKAYNGDLKRLFNTSGVQYRELKIKDKLPSMDINEAINLLSTNGRLVKRPFLVNKDVSLIGFKEDEWKHSF